MFTKYKLMIKVFFFLSFFPIDWWYW